jgi:hypothetical protein
MIARKFAQGFEHRETRRAVYALAKHQQTFRDE